ncbi:MAG: hypothetical protein IJ661_00315 [Lachnospiraceae bacterium]|nr:hypothetical protein [Lachnospiraceae bacterium]
MEQQYKAFMDRQHPSKELIADTLKKAQAEDEKDESLKRKMCGNAGGLKMAETIGFNGRHVPQYVFAACAVLFVLAVGIMRINGRVTYTELEEINYDAFYGSDAVSDGDTHGEDVNEVTQSYLGKLDASYYVFDSETRVRELEAGNGTVTLWIGNEGKTGLQSLYDIEPVKLKGHKVYLGSLEAEGNRLLLAAFSMDGRWYYMESDNATEKEMTECIRGLLR